MSMTPAASRIALYSMSWKSAYTGAEKYPLHSPQASFLFSACSRSKNAVPRLTVDLLFGTCGDSGSRAQG